MQQAFISSSENENTRKKKRICHFIHPIISVGNRRAWSAAVLGKSVCLFCVCVCVCVCARAHVCVCVSMFIADL